MEQENQSDYQAKINEIRKYVPFLENTIAQLKQESQDAKVAQMELLYKAITNLKPTKISLDDFKQCQEELENICELNNATADKEKSTSKKSVEIEESNSTGCQLETAANNPPANTETVQEAENVGAPVNCPQATAKILETCINSERRKPAENTHKTEEFKENNISEKLPSAASNTVEKKDCSTQENNPPRKNINQHTGSKEHSAAIQDLTLLSSNQPEQQKSNDDICNDNEKLPIEDNDDDVEKEKADNDVEKEEADDDVEKEEADDDVEKEEADDDVEKEEADDDVEKEKADDDVEKEKADDDVEKEKTDDDVEKEKTDDDVEKENDDDIEEENDDVEEENYDDDVEEENDADDVEEENDDDDVEEENVELIKEPEDIDGDEMILPDSVDGRDHINECSEDEEIIDKESILHEDSDDNAEDNADAVNSKESTFPSRNEHQKEHEAAEEMTKVDLESDMIVEEAAEESTLVGPETECPKGLENSSTDYDPLQVRKTPEEQAAEKENQVNEIVPDQSDNNDDDEVEIIETRNSPICLDSDDDDDDNGNEANRMDAVSPLLVPMEACASVPILPPNSDENTIELLDSSEDDLPAKQRGRKRRNANVALKSTPFLHKRTLLPQQKKYSSQAKNGSCDILATPDIYISEEDLPTKQRGRKKKNFPFALSSKPIKLQKRTLLPQQKKHSEVADDKCGFLPEPYAAVAPEKTAPVVNFTPTPQSNFLNAFNLQPTKPGENPPVFSAKLLNRDVIIPNAFYGNRPESHAIETSVPEAPQSSSSRVVTSITSQQTLDRAYRKWLENFLKCFTNPQHIASHTCFVLLQQTLKYKLFTRIKDMRTSLNTKAYNSTEETNAQLQHELRKAFYNGYKQLSEEGRRFCSMACNGIHNHAVTLTSDVHTGWVTSHTWTLQEMGYHRSVDRELATITSASTADTTASTSSGRKRHPEDDEYTPGKLLLPAMGGETNGERRKSLRSQRARRYDKGFSYNEDEADDDESEENDSYAVVQRKVEQKRLEAQQQRQRQAKSFENAFLETFARNSNRTPTFSCRVLSPTNRPKLAEICSRLETRKPASNASETHITLDDDGLDDEPKEHRIYKVIPTQLLVAPSEDYKVPSSHEMDADSAEIIICDDLDSNSNDVVAVNHSDDYVLPADAPKNIDINIHSMSRDHEWCILCQRRVTRIVHHYVNDHRGCEVYVSRLASSKVRRLRRNQGNTAEVSLYKNGQLQYEARCIFCLKPSRFMLPYWYQHFAMHTGEYAYRCSGCGLRKPTRSLLMAHTNQPCPQGGKLLRDYNYDSKATEITARICMLCNYVQLHRRSIVQHLHTQHNIQQILPKHIERVVLLQTTPQEHQPLQRNTRLQRRATCGVVQLDDSSDSNVSATAGQPYITSNYDDLGASQAGFWDQATPTDDLSFMICDMLDVQMDMD